VKQNETTYKSGKLAVKNAQIADLQTIAILINFVP